MGCLANPRQGTSGTARELNRAGHSRGNHEVVGRETGAPDRTRTTYEHCGARVTRDSKRGTASNAPLSQGRRAVHRTARRSFCSFRDRAVGAGRCGRCGPCGAAHDGCPQTNATPESAERTTRRLGGVPGHPFRRLRLRAPTMRGIPSASSGRCRPSPLSRVRSFTAGGTTRPRVRARPRARRAPRSQR